MCSENMNESPRWVVGATPASGSRGCWLMMRSRWRRLAMSGFPFEKQDDWIFP